MRERQHGADPAAPSTTDAAARTPGRTTRTAALAPVQRAAASSGGEAIPGDVHAAASHGLAGTGGTLPYVDVIQPLFGRHDVSHVVAHQDDRAREGAAQMGAEAFASGDRVAFGGMPTLHTVAHEAAHVVQQRAGVHLKGGVGEVGDRYEHHADAVADRVVRGESAEALLDELAGPPGAAASGPGTVQRIVRIDGNNVLPQHHAAFIDACRGFVEHHGQVWTQQMTEAVHAWLTDNDHVIAAGNAGTIAYNAFAHHADGHGAWEHGQTLTAIAPLAMGEARKRKHRERFASLMVPHATQTAKRVPGLGKHRDENLLRLGPADREEEEYWVRPSRASPERVMNAKRRKISARDETHITAGGYADKPTYTAWKDDTQLGHYYQGANAEFIKGGKHARTYGDKKEREGYQYKITGAVDGHSDQVQDDQPILGPYQSDAPEWKTKVPRDDGTSVEYDDSLALPTDAHDEKWFETHPHNFYWENPEWGKHVRQKAVETPAMSDKTSFLQHNTYTGQTAQPNKGAAKSHIYQVPSKLDILTTDQTGGQSHHVIDNLLTADYSNPSGYDPKTHRYPDVPGGKPSKSENTSLGGMGAHDHLEQAREPDTSKFPFATVLKPEEDDFEFKPDFRTSEPGYASPYQSPYHESGGLDEQSVTEPGDKSIEKHFARGKGLVKDAAYDDTTDQTDLTIESIRSSEPSAWASGKDRFAELFAARKPAVTTSGTTTGTTSGSITKPPTAPPKKDPKLLDYQHRYDVLRESMLGLRDALPDHGDNAAARGQLADLIAAFGAVSRDDAAQAAQIDTFYGLAHNWFVANRQRIVRPRTGGGPHEPANDPFGAAGSRSPALRQFFNECGQMAAFHAIEMLDGNGAPGQRNDDDLDGHGALEDGIDEVAIRQILHAAGRDDIPVMADFGQLQGLITAFQNDDMVTLANHGIDDDVELAGLGALDQFGRGNYRDLYAVVNAAGHTGTGGNHWIAVWLQWQDDGTIGIVYRDSYVHQLDHTDMFTALRAMFLTLPPPTAAPHGTGSGKKPDKAVTKAEKKS